MNFNKKQAIKLSFILLSSFLVLSCGDKSKKLTDSLSDVAKNVSATDEDETKKYNNYIGFYNDYLSSRINKGIDNYLEMAGDGAITKKEEASFSFSGENSGFWDRIENNIKAKPSMKELDAAAELLIPISKKTDSLFKLVKDYYSEKDYLEDNYAKAQELHTNILAEIKKFDEAFNKFDGALRNRAIEVRNKEIEQAKKEGREITYNKILVLSKIDQIMNELTAQKLNGSNMITADLSKIKPLYEEFNKTQKTLRDVGQNADMLKKEGFSSSSLLESYITSTTDFKTGVLDFIERVEKKEPVDATTLSSSVFLDNKKGTPENLFRLRDGVISSYNRIR